MPYPAPLLTGLPVMMAFPLFVPRWRDTVREEEEEEEEAPEFNTYMDGSNKSR